MSDEHRSQSERAVIDRLERLRVVLPALAQEAAAAKREVARLRAENRRLSHRLAGLESRAGALAASASSTATGARPDRDADVAPW
jgi:hypothetical protein